ncbi:MAG: hypothetical protein MK183_08315 [Verrucomicrobiales bacterium]|nr:hypothetical protein [Verrucomicrobiales bacterium]
MPHLVQMDKKYTNKGMVMIGAEVQNSSPEAIAKIANSHKLKFTLTKGIRGPRLSNGIPHTAVFDVKGNLVFNGHPSNPATEKAIKDALKDATPPSTDSAGNSFFNKPKYLVDERTWTNTDGKTLKAAMVSLNGKTGKFRFPNGRTFNYDITKLSEDDQSLIKEKAASQEDKGDQEAEKNKFEF